MLSFLGNNWLLISFLAPMLWAMVNIIDVYLVSGVYKDEISGTIIVGLFQVLPGFVTLFFIKDIDFLAIYPLLIMAVLGGFVYNLAFYFYFKALFHNVDVALLQIIWSLTVVVLPILTFIFWQEKLTLTQYLGMGIVLLGVVLLSLSRKIKENFSWRYFGIMMLAVLFVSISMILEDRVYLALDNIGASFFIGFAFFCFGGVLSGTTFAILKRRNPFPILRKYYKTFALNESVEVLGILASQRAIAIAPSVSFVAVVETFVPVFILIFSLLILFYLKNIAKEKVDLMRVIYKEQVKGIGIKIFAATVMAFGVYMLN